MLLDSSNHLGSVFVGLLSTGSAFCVLYVVESVTNSVGVAFRGFAIVQLVLAARLIYLGWKLPRRDRSTDARVA
jgi:hypothetical protein